MSYLLDTLPIMMFCFLHAASSNYLTLNFGRHSLKEVLDAPNVMNMIKDTKAAQEVILIALVDQHFSLSHSYLVQQLCLSQC
jgi:hypothetical protein